MSLALIDVTGWLKNNFSTKVFFIGLGCVLGIYIILGAWVTLNTEKNIRKATYKTGIKNNCYRRSLAK